MQPKQKINLKAYAHYLQNSDMESLDDLTLRNIIYQTWGEWNSCFTREDLIQQATEALSELDQYEADAEADKYADFHHGD
jgi:hypothetical protein